MGDKLLWFDFEIRFHPGLDNKAADTLSRVPHHSISLLQLLTLPYPINLEQLHDQIQLDPYLKSLYTDLLATPSSNPGFSILQGRLLFKNRLVIPSTSPLVSSILHQGHFSAGGPLGYSPNPQAYHSKFLLVRHEIRHLEICVQFASTTNLPISHQSASFNPSLSQLPFGRMSPWILLRTFPYLQAWTLSWWCWTT